ncbi:MAG: hypothetical protein GHCLOJNM_04169 [bacterium]|nr:hypothetical protein [bacterium]
MKSTPQELAGASDRGCIQREAESHSFSNAGTSTRVPIWVVLAKVGSSVPIEEWRKLPPDFSTNLDYYLYGPDSNQE